LLRTKHCRRSIRSQELVWKKLSHKLSGEVAF